MNTEKKINLGKDFSVTPIGRYADDSDYSGEIFREKYLIPALENHDKVYVTIDEAEGYGSSFLEEAFGGLVRSKKFEREELEKKLVIVSEKEDFKIYQKLIKNYIREAFNKIK